MKFHPDKRPDDKKAETYFKEIQEAYEVLSDPLRKEEYHFQRWRQRAMGEEMDYTPLHADEILAECIRLRNFVASSDIFRIDYGVLSKHILNLVSDHNLQLLKLDDNVDTNRKLMDALIQASGPLPYNHLGNILAELRKLAADDELMISQVEGYRKQKRLAAKLEKYKLVIVLAIVLMICLLIYSGRIRNQN